MKKFLFVAAAFAAMAPVPGPAQNADAVPTDVLSEVIVTAQRRAQNLQDVPISVTAFSAEQLERSNVRSAVNYLVQTPNVSFTEDAQSGSRGIGIAIRGVNNLVSGENAFVNSVGNYLDEFSIASVPNGVANPVLIDMDSVEVLRGPQGTLFGRNALGGALNLTTQAPTDELGGSVTLGGEEADGPGSAYNIIGVLNAPVSDTFGVRGVVFYEDSDGNVENIGPGTPDSGHEWFNVRLRAEWEPSDRTSLGLTFIYADDKQGTDENVPSGYLDLDTVDTFGFQPGVAFDPGTGFWSRNQSQLSHDLDEENKLETTIAILRYSQDVGEDMTFKVVAGLIDSTQDRLFDNDLIGNLDVLSRTNSYEGSSWSVEARLMSGTEKMDWVVGVMYAQDEQDQTNNVAVSSDPTATINGVGFLPPFPEGLGLALNTKHWELESAAVYGDLTYHATDRWDLIVGARYTSDDVVNQRTSYGLAPSCGCGPPDPAFFPSFVNVIRPRADADDSFSNVSPRAGVRYSWTDAVSAYAMVSGGYKAGGSSTGNDTNSPGSPPIVLPFEEETLWNYEIGVKSEFNDRRVRLNAAVFYLDWSDLQVEAFRFLTPGNLSSNFEQTVNVDSEAYGAELELLALLSERFTTGLSVGYLHTEITDEPVCDAPPPNTLPTCIRITGGFNVTTVGLPMPKAPEWNVYLFGEYRRPIGDNSYWIRGEYIFRDEQYSDVEALTNLQTRGPSPNQGLVRVVGADEFPYKVPSFQVLNLRGGYDWQRVSLSFFIENIAGEDYYTGTQENFGLSGIRVRPNPQTFGASVTFNF